MDATADHLFKILLFVLVVLNVHVFGQNTVNITLIYEAVVKGAVCLDGSPPAYYLDAGVGEAASNWIVHLEGGGWCKAEEDCHNRTKTSLGSSILLPNQISFWTGILSSNQTINPDFYNWNRVLVRYCDGASFSGNVDEVDSKYNLHRRGARIFNATIEDLMWKGLKNAKNAILAGNSAGGLATLLQCDNFRELITEVPNVKCIADSGFFIHAKDLANAFGRREYLFETIVEFHGMNGILSKSCTSKMDQKLCIFPENFIGDIKTPVFLVNSAFDQYQLQHHVQPVDPNWPSCTLGLKPCSPDQVKSIQGFGTTFKQTLPKRDCSSLGMIIDACLVHDHIIFNNRWAYSPTVNNKTIAKAFGDWFFNRSCSHDIDITHDFPYLCISKDLEFTEVLGDM